MINSRRLRQLWHQPKECLNFVSSRIWIILFAAGQLLATNTAGMMTVTMIAACTAWTASLVALPTSWPLVNFSNRFLRSFSFFLGKILCNMPADWARAMMTTVRASHGVAIESPSGYGSLIVIQGQKEDFLVEGKRSAIHRESS